MAKETAPTMLHQRLLQDIKEVQEKPYPGIELHVAESDLTRACLILTPSDQPPLHLTILFPDSYPLKPPRMSIQSAVSHPNVFDEYICASILNTEDGYTPSYTLKGVCIQILSFFSSDNVDQIYGGTLDRKEWQSMGRNGYYEMTRKDDHKCKACGFGLPLEVAAESSGTAEGATEMADVEAPPRQHVTAEMKENTKFTELKDLPAEMLLTICDYLETEDLFLAAQAWNGFSRLLRTHNIVRNRELQCFTLKEGPKTLELGIGVDTSSKPRSIQSEFDMISRQAYEYGVRKSVQGLRFNLWLPLPITQNHWTRVGGQVDEALNGIARLADVQGTLDTVLYTFMNEIVVRLSKDAEDLERPGGYHRRFASDGGPAPQSTLTHASEKAVESYFHLFHLLLCLAVEREDITKSANRLIYDFLTGVRDKQRVPNLGHLLIAILISDVDVSEDLTKAIIQETITRNVVWMLTNNSPELAFMETSAISNYRLQKTFEAGKTSYRLLMFLNLMRQVVRMARGMKDVKVDNDGNEVGKKDDGAWTKRKMNLAELRDDLFARHGAPPNGAAAHIACKIREIQKVNRFDEFLVIMGLQPPQASAFTSLLRQTVKDSMERGFSSETLLQEEALYLRLEYEGREVERPEGMRAQQPRYTRRGRYDFFPKREGRGGGAGGSGRGGAGGGTGGRGGGAWRGRGRGGYGRGRGR